MSVPPSPSLGQKTQSRRPFSIFSLSRERIKLHNMVDLLLELGRRRVSIRKSDASVSPPPTPLNVESRSDPTSLHSHCPRGSPFFSVRSRRLQGLRGRLRLRLLSSVGRQLGEEEKMRSISLLSFPFPSPLDLKSCWGMGGGRRQTLSPSPPPPQCQVLLGRERERRRKKREDGGDSILFAQIVPKTGGKRKLENRIDCYYKLV